MGDTKLDKQSRETCSDSDAAGFTLVEMLVVLGIIVLLAGMIAPQVIRYLGSARSQTASVQIKNIESALELYYLDNGQYPNDAEGLSALTQSPAGLKTWRGPYLKQASAVTDPWGKVYVYKQPGDHGNFDLSSFGRDGVQGGDGEDKDLQNWR